MLYASRNNHQKPSVTNEPINGQKGWVHPNSPPPPPNYLGCQIHKHKKVQKTSIFTKKNCTFHLKLACMKHSHSYNDTTCHTSYIEPIF